MASSQMARFLAEESSKPVALLHFGSGVREESSARREQGTVCVSRGRRVCTVCCVGVYGTHLLFASCPSCVCF